jgi:hypothetical protein
MDYMGIFGCQVQSKTLQLKTSNLWTSHENFSIDERKLPWPDLCGGCCGVKRTNHWSAQVHAWGQGVTGSMILRLWICRKYQGVTPSKSLWHLRVARSLLWSYTHRNSLLVLATSCNGHSFWRIKWDPSWMAGLDPFTHQTSSQCAGSWEACQAVQDQVRPRGRTKS